MFPRFFRTVFFSALALTAANIVHAAGKLVSGPMLGYRSHHETLIWVETKDAQTVALTYQITGKPETAQTLTHTAPPSTPAGMQPQKFVLPMLEMAQHYDYSLSIDGEKQPFPYPL